MVSFPNKHGHMDINNNKRDWRCDGLPMHFAIPPAFEQIVSSSSSTPAEPDAML